MLIVGLALHEIISERVFKVYLTWKYSKLIFFSNFFNSFDEMIKEIQKNYLMYFQAKYTFEKRKKKHKLSFHIKAWFIWTS